MAPESGYIQTERGSLLRILHRPAAGPRCAVLLLAPCGDEKRAAYGSCARIARALCESGAAVLRFDYYGTGDSAGESAEVTLSGMQRDAQLAAAHLREIVPDAPLCLMGVRMGASLALKMAADLGAAKAAAIAPLIDGASWLRQERGRRKLRRSMVRREMAAAGGTAPPAEEEALPLGIAEDLDGLPVSEEFARELEEFTLASGDAPPLPAALVLQVSPRRTPLPEVARAAESFGAKVECLRLEPFWQPLEPPDLEELVALLRGFLTGADE